MQQRYLKYVLRRGYCVRSPIYGLGQVLAEGERPLIRFLDGRECRVSADTLRYVPDEEFEAEIANRPAIETWLILRVHGREALGPGDRLWVKDADGFWTTTNKLPEEPTCPPGVFEFFFPDDIGDDCHVIQPAQPSGDSPSPVTATQTIAAIVHFQPTN